MLRRADTPPSPHRIGPHQRHPDGPALPFRPWSRHQPSRPCASLAARASHPLQCLGQGLLPAIDARQIADQHPTLASAARREAVDHERRAVQLGQRRGQDDSAATARGRNVMGTRPPGRIAWSAVSCPTRVRPAPTWLDLGPLRWGGPDAAAFRCLNIAADTPRSPGRLLHRLSRFRTYPHRLLSVMLRACQNAPCVPRMVGSGST